MRCLELWFDFSCPYAYLASRRAERIAADAKVPLVWCPMLLGGVFRGTGAGDGPMATLSPAKARNNVHDMHRWAQLFEVPFRMPAAHPMRTVRALRLLLALPEARWPAAIAAIYAAYWERGEDITRDDVLLAALAGIPEAAAALARADDDTIKSELRRRTDEAIALGIFGAPAWVIRRDDLPPLMFWGQDRIAWVEAALAGWDPETPLHRVTPAATIAPGATLDVYFDVGSPYAYLALTQLATMVRSARLVPIALGALFRDVGTPNVPLFAMVPAKTRYTGRDMQTWASWWGVKLALPTRFPQRTLTAQRLCVIAAEEGYDTQLRLATALGRAMWTDNRNLEDADTLRGVLAETGLPPAWIERTAEPAIKQALIDNTAAARELGVFGVPTFVVGPEPTVFWGQDRLELVARALAGWRPEAT